MVYEMVSMVIASWLHPILRGSANTRQGAKAKSKTQRPGSGAIGSVIGPPLQAFPSAYLTHHSCQAAAAAATLTSFSFPVNTVCRHTCGSSLDLIKKG